MNGKILLGYAHGLFWKIASTLSKFLFLIVVVPQLPDGVYAGYLYSISITLIPAILLSVGMSEHLPVLIKGDAEVMNDFSPFYVFSLVGCFITFASYMLTGAYVFLLGSIIFAHLTYYIVAGLLRSVDPRYYEWLINLPTIIFLIVCFAAKIDSEEHLLFVFILTNVAIYMAVAFIGNVSLSIRLNRLKNSFDSISATLSKGMSKAISNMLLIVNFRGLIIFPKLILQHPPSDTLAIAINAGEAVYQFAVIVSNRNFAHYCRGEGTPKSLLQVSAMMLLSMTVIGLVFILWEIPLTLTKFDWSLVGWAIIFFSSLIVVVEMRNYLWSRNIGEPWIFAAQFAIIIVQLIVVLSVGEDMWMATTAMVCTGVTMLLLGFALALRRK